MAGGSRSGCTYEQDGHGRGSLCCGFCAMAGPVGTSDCDRDGGGEASDGNRCWDAEGAGKAPPSVAASSTDSKRAGSCAGTPRAGGSVAASRTARMLGGGWCVWGTEAVAAATDDAEHTASVLNSERPEAASCSASSYRASPRASPGLLPDAGIVWRRDGSCVWRVSRAHGETPASCEGKVLPCAGSVRTTKNKRRGTRVCLGMGGGWVDGSSQMGNSEQR